MEQSLEKKLIEALEALERGEPVNQVLTRYPEDSDQLRPMLETAVQLARLNLQPSLAAQSHSRQAFLSQAETLRQGLDRRSPLARGPQLLLPLLSLALVLLVFGGTLFISASSAVPGNRLYQVKRLGESLRLALAADPATRATLVEQYRRERIEEIQVLLASGREAEVEFEGLIESIEEGRWVVATLVTAVDDATAISGMPEVGLWAHVIGETRAGRLHAVMITVSPDDNRPTPTPAVDPTATVTVRPAATETAQPTSTRESTSTATVEPSSTLTSTATATMSPTVTPTPQATATFQPTTTIPPAPTATPVSVGNDNDDDNDNSNDNDNDNANDNDNGNDNDNYNANDNDDDNSGNSSDNDDRDGGNGNDNENRGDENNNEDDN